jgi:hypothetical protein
MSKRLGEVLIERGILDERKIKLVLDAQMIYGGHFGTCLVEFGFVDIDTLGQTLADTFNVEHANRDLLEGVPASVLKLLPGNLAEKHKAIPFQLEDRTLRVAMIDPRDLLALDELSFASGYRIEPWVAPEILIVRYMEQYYEVPRQLRHITVSGEALKVPSRSPTPTPAPAPAPPAEEDLPQIDRPPLVPLERLAPLAPPRAAEVQPEITPPPGAAPEPPAAPEAAQTNAADDVGLLDLDDDLDEPSPRVVTATPGTRTKRRSEIFVPQAVPDYQRKARKDGLHLDWIKYKRTDDEPSRWCDLFKIDLDDPYFDELEGVLVIWHHGQQPVLRAGHGKIRFSLQAARQNDDILAISQESPIFVSWAKVEESRRAGVERYLIDMLNPRVHAILRPVDPIEVNLPR